MKDTIERNIESTFKLKCVQLKNATKFEPINEIGLSYKIDLPKDYNDLLNGDGTKDLFTLFYIRIDENELSRKRTNIIPLTFRLVLCWRENEVNYELQSYLLNENTNIINFTNNSDYYFNIKSYEYLRKINGKYKEVTPEEIFETLYKKHVNKGGKKKKNIFIERVKYRIFSYGELYFSTLYSIISGYKLKFAQSLIEAYQFDSKIIEKKEIINTHIEFFNNTVNIIPIISYSIIHLLGYIFCYLLKFRPNIYITILKNEFLLVMYVIVTMFLFEYIIGRTVLMIAECFCEYKIKCSVELNM